MSGTVSQLNRQCAKVTITLSLRLSGWSGRRPMSPVAIPEKQLQAMLDATSHGGEPLAGRKSTVMIHR
jgi:hypothetical protein